MAAGANTPTYRAKAHPHARVAAVAPVGILRRKLREFGYSPSDVEAEVERRLAHGLSMEFATNCPKEA